MAKVFLGGTVNGSAWRDKIIQELKISYFNPVVKIWNELAFQKEAKEKDSADFRLYVITPKQTGFYSIAELVDDSNKIPKKTVCCFLMKDDELEFTPHQIKSLDKIKEMVKRNGAHVFDSLEEVAVFLNKHS